MASSRSSGPFVVAAYVLSLILLGGCHGKRAGVKCRVEEFYTIPSYNGEWLPQNPPSRPASKHLVTHRLIRTCSDGSTEIVKEWTQVEVW